MDASYVQSVTGSSLVEGLAAIVTHQPVSVALSPGLANFFGAIP